MKKSLVMLSLTLTLLFGLTAGAFAASNLEDIRAYLNKGVSIVYNGEAQIMKNVNGDRVYPITYEGTTYLPVRAVANLFGIYVDWDGANNRVLLSETPFTSTTPTTEVQPATSGYEKCTFVVSGYESNVSLPKEWKPVTGSSFVMFSPEEDVSVTWQDSFLDTNAEGVRNWKETNRSVFGKLIYEETFTDADNGTAIYVEAYKTTYDATVHKALHWTVGGTWLEVIIYDYANKYNTVDAFLKYGIHTE